MATVTLTDFLLARIAEDERAARDCLAAVGSTREGEPYPDGSGIADRDDFPSYPWGLHPAEDVFLAGAGHPARILAECAAKRRLVERAAEPIARIDLRDGPDWGSISFTRSDGQRVYDQHGRDVTEEWEAYCRAHAEPTDPTTLRTLAAVYADHPDYRRDWWA